MPCGPMLHRYRGAKFAPSDSIPCDSIGPRLAARPVRPVPINATKVDEESRKENVEPGSLGNTGRPKPANPDEFPRHPSPLAIGWPKGIDTGALPSSGPRKPKHAGQQGRSIPHA